MTTEFRHGTITPTLLATPGRERVLAGKAIAGVLIAILFAVLAILVVAVVARSGRRSTAESSTSRTATSPSARPRPCSALCSGCCSGVAIGAVVHNQVAALVGTLVWIFLVETLLVGLVGLVDVDERGGVPARSIALDGADGTGGDNLLDYGPALAVTLGWIALLGAAGVVRTLRRDLT